MNVFKPLLESGAVARPWRHRALGIGHALIIGLWCSAMLLSFKAHAQWQSQSFTLAPGWNAIYLHVDTSHTLIENVVPTNAISEVWLWRPVLSSAQFVTSPQTPTGGNSQWSSWNRTNGVNGASSELRRMAGNASYLVHNTNAANYVWTIKGRPVPFTFQWTTTGLNLLGFPTPTNTPPRWDPFLTPAPDLQRLAEIYFYPGGPLSTNNPRRLLTLTTTPVTRGQAWWVRSGTLFNNYYGPFHVTAPGASGADFQDTIGQVRIRLSNRTTTDRTVTVRLLPSESAPTGQKAISGLPPLLLRGELNAADQTYAFSNVTTNSTNFFTLKGKAASGQSVGGQELEVVIGVNRSAMTGAAGDLFAGILRFADTNGLSQWDVPVSATVASPAGLWVGAAAVSQVRNSLVTYQKDATGATVQGTNGAFVVSSVNTNLGIVAQPFPLRLILHTATNGSSVLLQRVFYGIRQQTNLVVSTTESVLDTATLSSARRISAAHLPVTTNNATWPCTGRLAAATNLSVTVTVPYDSHPSNPFLHRYHPDHDSLDPTFKTQLAQGFESYRIERALKLTLTAPANDFNSLTRGTTTLSGDYEETLTLGGKTGESRVFESRGTFSLNRVSPVGTLTTQ